MTKRTTIMIGTLLFLIMGASALQFLLLAG